MNSPLWPEPLRPVIRARWGHIGCRGGWGRRDGPGVPGPVPGRPAGRGEAGAARACDDAGFRRRFALEVEAARRVGGFYTAQVVDADPDADPPWLVTAYIPGPSLHRPSHARPAAAAAIGVLGRGAGRGLGRDPRLRTGAPRPQTRQRDPGRRRPPRHRLRHRPRPGCHPHTSSIVWNPGVHVPRTGTRRPRRPAERRVLPRLGPGLRRHRQQPLRHRPGRRDHLPHHPRRPRSDRPARRPGRPGAACLAKIPATGPPWPPSSAGSPPPRPPHPMAPEAITTMIAERQVQTPPTPAPFPSSDPGTHKGRTRDDPDHGRALDTPGDTEQYPHEPGYRAPSGSDMLTSRPAA